MPRVHTKTKATYGRVYNCSRCGEPITPGQRFYMWTKGRRHGITYRQHTEHGYPRPTQLSNRKTAVIEETVQDTNLGSWDPEPTNTGDGWTWETDTSEISDQLQAVADVARDVASEYEDGVSNMPESLQYAPTGEAMTDVAQRLNDWADELEGWEPQTDPDFPEREEDETDEEYEERAAQLCNDWVEEVRDSAQSLLEEMPEYEG